MLNRGQLVVLLLSAATLHCAADEQQAQTESGSKTTAPADSKPSGGGIRMPVPPGAQEDVPVSDIAPQAASGSDGWVGTWAVAHEATPVAVAGQTWRQIVHTSTGGNVARIRISNFFGDAPLTLGQAFIAQPTQGALVDANSAIALTFAGADVVTIAPGQVAVSDPADFAVAAQSNVAVSFYISAGGTTGACHTDAGQTNHVAKGSVLAGDPWPEDAQSTTTYCFVAALDVINFEAEGAIVAFGASITDGHNATENRNRRWPNLLSARLSAADRQFGVLNSGISGNRLLEDGAGQSALLRFGRDALQHTGVRWVILADDALNDLGLTLPQPSADMLISALQQLVRQAHAVDVRVVCATLTPFRGSVLWTSKGEAARQAYNAFLFGAGSDCDALFDQAAALADPADPTLMSSTYDSGDRMHPNDAGMQALADAFELHTLD